MLAEHHRASGDLDLVGDHMLEAILKATTSATDQIWNLAKEFSYDPIRYDIEQMRDVLGCHIEIEVCRISGVDPEYTRNLTDQYLEAIRDSVNMTAMRYIMDDALENVLDGIASNLPTAVLVEEVLDIMVRAQVKHNGARRA